MITCEMIQQAQEQLISHWKDAGKRVIEETAKVSPFNGDSKKFLDYCTACGGNWGGMFLSGIRELYPVVWDAIPDNMGINPFVCICSVLILCGVDTSE